MEQRGTKLWAVRRVVICVGDCGRVGDDCVLVKTYCLSGPLCDAEYVLMCGDEGQYFVFGGNQVQSKEFVRRPKVVNRYFESVVVESFNGLFEVEVVVDEECVERECLIYLINRQEETSHLTRP